MMIIMEIETEIKRKNGNKDGKIIIEEKIMLLIKNNDGNDKNE